MVVSTLQNTSTFQSIHQQQTKDQINNDIRSSWTSLHCLSQEIACDILIQLDLGTLNHFMRVSKRCYYFTCFNYFWEKKCNIDYPQVPDTEYYKGNWKEVYKSRSFGKYAPVLRTILFPPTISFAIAYNNTTDFVLGRTGLKLLTKTSRESINKSLNDWSFRSRINLFGEENFLISLNSDEVKLAAVGCKKEATRFSVILKKGNGILLVQGKELKDCVFYASSILESINFD